MVPMRLHLISLLEWKTRITWICAAFAPPRGRGIHSKLHLTWLQRSALLTSASASSSMPLSDVFMVVVGRCWLLVVDVLVCEGRREEGVVVDE